MNFIDIILPRPLQNLFTYRITPDEANFLRPGMRVAVPFGKSKIATGIVAHIHQEEPTAYKVKDIYQILDKSPIVSEIQLKHWQWLAKYYMCTVGEVLKAALPAAFLLESETLVLKNKNFKGEHELDDNEFLVVEALEKQPVLPIKKIKDIVDKKRILPILNTLLDKNAIVLKEEVVERYSPKLVKYIRLHAAYDDEEQLQYLLDGLTNAPQQRHAILTYFSLKGSTQKPIAKKKLREVSQVSSSVVKALIAKEIFEVYTVQTDRVQFKDATQELKKLTEHQQEAYGQIKIHFQQKDVVLLKGITSSGKTEIYVRLIHEIIQKGQQVLYLLPEIALTAQLIIRLQKYFGNKIAVFHSKYSLNERVEVWKNVLLAKETAQIVLGVRSSIFLPFSDLGLIIVDEEHETSFKQFDPAPRYHARDAAIVLANYHKAKVLMGSATPSVESFYNVSQKKYALVELTERYSKVLLPEINLIDIKEGFRKKRMKGHFSEALFKLVENTLAEKKQVILFQNRRGYSPVVECASCGVSPQCVNCDVSLTYHKLRNELQCHYCGYTIAMPKTCKACGNPTLNTKGFGTEQVEIEIKELFPEAKVGRMDLDTTRGKYGYEKIINAFQAREIDILVGTQMLSKGLDFAHVAVVGVMNADNMLNFPDFRAHEKCFQLLVQVSGRAGRAEKQGKVLIQTFNPYHRILQQVTTNDYAGMYKEQLYERHQYKYPPFLRMIRITLKHKDINRVNSAADWLQKSLFNVFKEGVLGPTSPAVGRVRNQYIKNLLIKLPTDIPLQKSKSALQKIKNSFESISEFRSVRINVDVDPH